MGARILVVILYAHGYDGLFFTPFGKCRAHQKHTHTKVGAKSETDKKSMAADLCALAKWRGAIGTGGGDRSSFVDFVYFGSTQRERAAHDLAAVWDRHIRLYEDGQARLEKGEVSKDEHMRARTDSYIVRTRLRRAFFLLHLGNVAPIKNTHKSWSEK